MVFKLNQAVWYTEKKKKAIVKELVDGKVKITYFNKDDKRVVEIVDPKKLTILNPKKETKKMLDVKIKYHADIEKIAHIEQGDWVDLRAAEDVEMKTGDYKLISLGVGFKLPEGYEAHVVPRSSTFKTWGILQTNSMGVIDNSYSGNGDIWRFPAYATRNTVIKKNDRICQFRIQQIQPKFTLTEVDNLDNVSRGGFGSTGSN